MTTATSTPEWLQSVLGPAPGNSPDHNPYRELLLERGWPHARTEGWREFPWQAFRELTGNGLHPWTEPRPSPEIERTEDLQNNRIIVRNGAVQKGAVIDEVGCRCDFQIQDFGNLHWLDRLEASSLALLNLASSAGTVALDLQKRDDESAAVVNLEETLQAPQAGSVVHAQYLIRARAGAQLTIVHRVNATEQDVPVLYNPLILFHLEEGAKIRYIRVINASQEVWQLGSLWAELASAADFQSDVFSFSGGVIRDEQHIRLCGEEATCGTRSLCLPREGQTHEINTNIEHAVPHTGSEQLAKYVLSDASRGHFRGRILVARGAQKTEAHQKSAFLLLHPQAKSHTEPHLEIYADDVVCSHGATVGQLDENQLFYLQSRGISQDEARMMLILAFA
ncbi:MAG: SufD family Fe-S cluster assembly protein, partial [Lentisphaerae bacterium]